MSNPLLDKDFLLKLDKQRNRKTYARIIVLDLEERPVEQIEGLVTGGTINIDGSSAVRRSCSLTVAGAQNTTITERYWALKNKFKLEIGLENNIDAQYPSIIWFKQGIYGISAFSMNETVNNFTISISGKDKMAYLNGEFGGNIFAQHDFGSYDQVLANGEIETKKIKIYEIIRQAVHEYGQEPFHNIVINDLSNYGYELWDYRGVDENGEGAPMFYFYKQSDNTQVLRNMSLNGDQIVYQYKGMGLFADPEQLKNIPDERLFWRNSLIEQDEDVLYKTTGPTNIADYKISRINYGDTAGYHGVDLVYAGELVLNAGEAITSLLDKIKTMLGEYEYFYDLDGKFIFQKKRTYLQGLFSPIIDNAVNPTVVVSPYSYKFNTDEMVVSYSNAPVITDVKNDFAVWGTRKNIDGTDLPIHARFAITHKPTKYESQGRYEGAQLRHIAWKIETVTEDNYSSHTYYEKRNAGIDNIPYAHYVMISNPTQGKEYYYQIEKDKTESQIRAEYKERIDFLQEKLNKGNLSDQETTITSNRINELKEEVEKLQYTICEITYSNSLFNERYPSGQNLYDKSHNPYILNGDTDLSEQPLYNKINPRTYTVSDCDWREILYQMAMDFYAHSAESDFNNKRTGYEPFYADMQAFWRNIYNPMGLAEDDFVTSGLYNHWHKNALYYPENLTFWIDFLDTYGELNNYSIDTIGHRPKVENGSGITAIAYKETPEVEFKIIGVDDIKATSDLALAILQIPEASKDLFKVSSQGQSAMNKIDELVYKHVCMAESINISTIPIYYLEPNTRIYAHSELSKIDGDYIISRISIPLTYNGQMQITATKVIKQLN